MLNLEKANRETEDMKCPHCIRSITINSYERSNLTELLESLDKDNAATCPYCFETFIITTNVTFKTSRK